MSNTVPTQKKVSFNYLSKQNRTAGGQRRKVTFHQNKEQQKRYVVESVPMYRSHPVPVPALNEIRGYHYGNQLSGNRPSPPTYIFQSGDRGNLQGVRNTGMNFYVTDQDPPVSIERKTNVGILGGNYPRNDVDMVFPLVHSKISRKGQEYVQDSRKHKQQGHRDEHTQNEQSQSRCKSLLPWILCGLISSALIAALVLFILCRVHSKQREIDPAIIQSRPDPIIVPITTVQKPTIQQEQECVNPKFTAPNIMPCRRKQLTGTRDNTIYYNGTQDSARSSFNARTITQRPSDSIYPSNDQQYNPKYADTRKNYPSTTESYQWFNQVDHTNYRYLHLRRNL